MNAYKPPLFDRIRNAAGLIVSALAFDLMLALLLIV